MFKTNKHKQCIPRFTKSLIKRLYSASLVALSVKNLPAAQETRVRSLGWEDPLEKEMAIHWSILAWRISWAEEPGGLQSMGSQRVGHDYATNTNSAWQPRKSRGTWSNRQFWPWSTKWSRAKANRVSPRERTANSKHPLSTTQEKTTHGHHQMVNTKIRLTVFLQPKMEKQQKQDWELTVAQIMNSLLPNSDLHWGK